MLYDELKEAVLPHMEAFMDDVLVHDKRCLEDNPGVPFLHWTRSTGTDLYFLHPADSEYYPPAGQFERFLFGMANRDHFLKAVYEVAKFEQAQSHRIVHYFDGCKLRLIDCEQAVKIARQHVSDVQKIWQPAPKPASYMLCNY